MSKGEQEQSLSLNDITPPSISTTSDSSKTAYVDAERELELERKKQEATFALDNHKARIRYSRYIFVLVCIWLTAVLVVCIAQGIPRIGFHLSDSILITLLGTTTANVIGVLIIVLRYLFPQK